MFRRRRPRPGHPYLAGAPLLIAHRGGSRIAPENTLKAFRTAVDVWDADILELDVRCTSDGRLVVLHDATVERTTDGIGSIAEMGWDQVRELDAGARFLDPDGGSPFLGRGVGIPLLEDVLEAFPRTRLNVEVKCPEAAPLLGRIVRRFGAEHRVLVAAARDADRKALRGYPGPWGASRGQIFRFRFLHRMPVVGGAPAVDAFQIPERWKGLRVLTPGFVEAAHRWNVPVHVWTVDDPDDMRRYLRWGVDGIQSDRPDVLARVLAEEAGRPLPPGLDGEGPAAGSAGATADA